MILKLNYKKLEEEVNKIKTKSKRNGDFMLYRNKCLGEVFKS